MVEIGKTIDHQYYINKWLEPAFSAICKVRKSKCLNNIRLLHDNARPHIHKNVNNFLTEHGIKVIKHPPYSPDLAPCDFWLNDYLKKNLDDYEDEYSLYNAVTKILKNISIEEYKKTFNKWIERMEMCVKNDGDYFEHLIK